MWTGTILTYFFIFRFFYLLVIYLLVIRSISDNLIFFLHGVVFHSTNLGWIMDHCITCESSLLLISGHLMDNLKLIPNSQKKQVEWKTLQETIKIRYTYQSIEQIKAHYTCPFIIYTDHESKYVVYCQFCGFNFQKSRNQLVCLCVCLFLPEVKH